MEINQQTFAYGALAVVIMAAGALLLRRWLGGRVTPEEIERRRRDSIQQSGKLGDAEVEDVDGVNIIYTYRVAGVGYTVSQDVSALESLLPLDRMTLVGPAAVKFLPRNPANSIVLSEHWSGVRRRVR